MTASGRFAILWKWNARRLCQQKAFDDHVRQISFQSAMKPQLSGLMTGACQIIKNLKICKCWNRSFTVRVLLFLWCLWSFFLQKWDRRCCFVLQGFTFIDMQGLQSVRMLLKFKSASCLSKSSNVSAQFGAFTRKTFFTEALSSIVSSLFFGNPTLNFTWQSCDV